MDVRPGYKQTEVGSIPDDWRVVGLGDVCAFENGDRSSNYPSPGSFVSSGIPFINAGHVAEGKIDSSAMNYITPESFRRLTSGKVLEGDILFCLRGSLGKFGVVGEEFGEGAIASSLVIVRPKSSSLDREFLGCYFSSALCARMIETWAGGAAQPNLGAKDLARFLVPLPSSKAEQRAIAATLSDVDALLGGLERLIAKKRDLKQAAMQQLLTGQTRLPGFSGTWEEKRVVELGEIVTGGTPRTDVKEYWGEGYPWVTPTDISTHRDMYTSERALTEKGLNSIRVLPANTVLVTCIASIGKNAILRSKGGCNQQINAVIPSDKNAAEFLYYLFEVSKQYLLANAGTTATSIVSKATFGEMTFIVPSLPEQTAIATVLSDVDAELSALVARRDKTRALKQAMMQELLTGRTRLV